MNFYLDDEVKKDKFLRLKSARHMQAFEWNIRFDFYRCQPIHICVENHFKLLKIFSMMDGCLFRITSTWHCLLLISNGKTSSSAFWWYNSFDLRKKIENKTHGDVLFKIFWTIVHWSPCLISMANQSCHRFIVVQYLCICAWRLIMVDRFHRYRHWIRCLS